MNIRQDKENMKRTNWEKFKKCGFFCATNRAYNNEKLKDKLPPGAT